MTERSYVVGLPVSITVKDDGWVQVECDLSEAGQSIRKDSWGQVGDEADRMPTEEQLIADADTVDRWAEKNMLAHGGFAPDDRLIGDGGPADTERGKHELDAGLEEDHRIIRKFNQGEGS